MQERTGYVDLPAAGVIGMGIGVMSCFRDFCDACCSCSGKTVWGAYPYVISLYISTRPRSSVSPAGETGDRCMTWRCETGQTGKIGQSVQH